MLSLHQKLKMRERRRSLILYKDMNKEQIIETVHEQLAALLADNTAHFLVDVRIKPTNNIKIFIDGDNGVSIDDLVKYNRKLYKVLEEMALFPEGDYSLEVSSAGLDEPLKLERQYIKNIGRLVDITLLDGSVLSGDLMKYENEVITMQYTEGKGKKAAVKTVEIPLADIKTTKIGIKF